jgi:hypothetical protein
MAIIGKKEEIPDTTCFNCLCRKLRIHTVSVLVLYSILYHPIFMIT